MIALRPVRPHAVAVALALASGAAPSRPVLAADRGVLGIDRRLDYSATGPWSETNQLWLYRASIVVPWAGALVEGAETRIGRTWWRAAESATASLPALTLVKRATGRMRPDQSEPPDADAWFRGSAHQSFPSGHVTVATAAVLPFVLEYRHDAPAVWALAAIPLYMGVARVRTQAHWQTDVLGGWALGAVSAWLTGLPDSPLVLRAFGDGGFVGLRYRF